MKVIIGMSGASGTPYGIRLVQALKVQPLKIQPLKVQSLKSEHVDVGLIVSEKAAFIAGVEGTLPEGWPDAFVSAAYDDRDLAAPPASGSHPFDAMVIVPCSMSTVGKIASGIGDTLITRAAGVCLKERRRLIVVPRETPLSLIHLRSLTTLAEAGAIIMPAMPAFYPRPETVSDMVDFMVGRIMELLGMNNELYPAWNG